jgi:peptidoglycan/LPS O-acetylase OafA/YrhL
MLFVIVVTSLIDFVLHSAGVYPPMNQSLDDRQSWIALSYRIVLGIAGGWLTARLAPRNAMKHALILGAIGTVLGLIGVVVTWDKGLGPHWYPISLAVLAIPQSWAGAKIEEN